MSTEPDPADDDSAADAPQPGLTRGAAILWIVMGVIFFVFGCLNMITNAMVAAQRPNRPDPGTGSCAVWLSFAIGAALFVAGKNLASGKAKDVLTASILSILLGLFYAVVAVASVMFLAQNEVLALILGGVSIVIAIGCVLPGVLALAGRSQYRAWRRARFLARRARRRRYEEEDDEEERREEDDRGPEERPWDRGAT